MPHAYICVTIHNNAITSTTFIFIPVMKLFSTLLLRAGIVAGISKTTSGDGSVDSERYIPYSAKFSSFQCTKFSRFFED